MQQADIIIIGAGAAGLMAARILSKSGKSALVLEARERIGGRILPLDEKKFGYPAQGGAEFVDGPAPYTRDLAQEAGLTVTQHETFTWRWRGKKLFAEGGHDELMSYLATIRPVLQNLKEDIPLAQFLKRHFGDPEYTMLRRSISQIAEEYDAADPGIVSTFELRDGWLSHGFKQARIKEGYGALVDFLAKECQGNEVKIQLGKEAVSIDISDKRAKIRCADGDVFEAEKVVVTVPVSLLGEITFRPAMPHIKEAVSKIGFGGAIKALLKFKKRWWVDATGADLRNFFILLTDGPFTYWSQYPRDFPVLTGWVSGPRVSKFARAGKEEIIDLMLSSLAEIFSFKEEKIREMLILSEVFNWVSDPYSRGAYSYSTVNTEIAVKALNRPVNGTLYFAGEAVAGWERASVEAALESGTTAAHKILIR